MRCQCDVITKKTNPTDSCTEYSNNQIKNVCLSALGVDQAVAVVLDLILSPTFTLLTITADHHLLSLSMCLPG